MAGGEKGVRHLLAAGRQSDNDDVGGGIHVIERREGYIELLAANIRALNEQALGLRDLGAKLGFGDVRSNGAKVVKRD
jgi:hypothetical protein